MKKILITGGAGFIARNIFEQLNKDYDIISIDIKELDLLDSLKASDYLKSNKFDAIIHAANYDASTKFNSNDPAKVLENNLKMFFNIIRNKDCFGKMIYFGSGAEFGRENWFSKMKENDFDKNVPQDQYGFSKYIMTKYAQSAGGIYNLRLFGVFGKYEDFRYRFISNACCRAVMDMPILINQNTHFDYLHVDDLARVVKWFIDNEPKNKVYNVCPGQAYDLKTIAEKIVKISGKNLSIEIKEKELGREYSGDNALLMEESKGFKFSSTDDKIRELYDWYNINRNIIRKEEL
ncbi:MAG: NAD(P)-dependent oxidoreductase [Candidatus Staskawiczbacteria bacterium]|nr:NAD(P)-dependent oxidoreductase [Candidatus Staskawiczbacteria bacterium]